MLALAKEVLVPIIGPESIVTVGEEFCRGRRAGGAARAAIAQERTKAT